MTAPSNPSPGSPAPEPTPTPAPFSRIRVEDFDDLAALAAQLCASPLAFLWLAHGPHVRVGGTVALEEHEQGAAVAWFRRCSGAAGFLEIRNTTDDEAGRTNGLVVGARRLRFFAGVPLHVADRHTVGALCVFDQQPRTLTAAQRHGLTRLARQVQRLVDDAAGGARPAEAPGHVPAEALLRRMEFVLERARDAVFWVRYDGGFDYVNDAACRMLGYTREELLAINVFDLDPNISRETWPLLWRGARAHGSQLETEHKARDGRLIPIEIAANVVEFEGREFNCCFARDLSERRQMERDLKLTQLCVERAAIAVFRVEKDGRIASVNQQVCASLGYSREELLRMTIFEIDRRIDEAEWTEHRRTLPAAGSRTVERTHWRKDGSSFPVEVTVTHLVDQGQEFCFSFARNITQRKRAEEEVRRREAQLRGITLSLPGVVYQVQPDKIEGLSVRFASDRLTEMLEISPQPGGLFQRVIERLDPRDRPAVLEKIARSVEQNAPCDFEARYLKPSGGMIWVRSIATPATIDGELVFNGILLDTTEHRKVLESLRESERLLKESQRVARLGDYVYDLTTGLWTPSERLRVVFGIADDYRCDVAGWLQIAHPDEREGLATYLREQVLEARQRFDREYRIIRIGDAQERWVHGLGELILDEAGSPTRMIGTIQDITDRKRTEEALHQSESVLQASMEAINDGVLVVAASGRVLHCNSHFRELWSMPDGVAAAGTEQVLHAHLMAQLSRPLEFAAAFERMRGSVGATDDVLPLKDGRILEQLSFPMGDAERPNGRVWSYRDVTERTRVEQALRIASQARASGEQLFTTLVSQLAQMLDACCVFVGVLTGPQNDRLRTLAWWKDGATGERVDFELASTPCELVVGGQPFVVERDLAERFPGSSPFRDASAVSFAAVPLFDAKNRTLGLVAVLGRHPIAESQSILRVLETLAVPLSAEIERHRNEKQFHDLFELGPDAIVMTDAQGTIVLANAKAEQLFGWKRQELLGNAFEFLVAPDSQETTKAMRARPLASPASSPAESGRASITAVRKNGSRFPVDISLSPIETDHGTIVAAAVRDVSRQKEAERQAWRTQRLESLGTLSGGIAHDLNNVLTPILAGAGLLRRRLPESEHELVDNMEASARRGAEMVRQLLTFARGTEGERGPVVIRHVLREIESILKSSFPKNIALAVRCPRDLRLVEGDATQIHQVLLNLCVNARDAMPDGGTLTLEAANADVDALFSQGQPDAKPGSYVVLRVADTGTGIAPEILDRIFEPFFTTKDSARGTGLGLSTVLGIVKGHGGFIQVQSPPGAGSSFSVHFPACVTPSEEEAVVREPGAERHGVGEVVLVADDEPLVRGMVGGALRRQGFTVVEATDGTDALIHAVQLRSTLALVLTDLNMPQTDGVGLVRALRRVLPDVPIVAMSGRHEDAKTRELRSLGVRVFLDKPFTAQRLFAAIGQALKPKI